MTKEINGARIRTVLLEVVNDHARSGTSLQSRSILNEAATRLRIDDDINSSQALLTFWYDLFRMGHLSWGTNISNPDPPFCHLTEQGRKTLEHLGRDPANPDGYLAYISGLGKLNPVAQSYLDEGLKSYNSGCFKAAAVMVGAAAESIIIELRDMLVGRMRSLTKPIPKNLNDWRVKTILDALKSELDAHKNTMPKRLAEAYEAYWSAFTQQVRQARNEAGHPTSIDPVTVETVHASLLIFPELARLAFELKDCISNQYT